LELDSAIAKLPDYRKVDVIRALVSIVNDIVFESSGDAAASNKNDKAEETLALKDRLKLILAIEDLLKRYNKNVVRLALVSIIDGMVRGKNARSSDDEMLRK
jgi:hypothetical protein